MTGPGLSRRPLRRWLRGFRGTACLAGVVLSLVALGVPSTSGAFTARVANSANTVTTAPAFTCAGLAKVANAFYTYSMDEATSLTAMLDVSGNGRNGTYQGVSTHATDQGCNRDGGGSTSFMAGSYASTPVQLTNPLVFTIEVWFRTTSTSGGLVMGFANTQTGQPTQYDRHVYLTNAGNLVFGTYDGTTHTITSPSTYNNGTWHHVAATLGPSGMVLYVDGASVGTNSTATAQNYAGWWRIASGNLANWPSVPTNQYFTGQLDYFSYYPTVLSASTVAAHYGVRT